MASTMAHLLPRHIQNFSEAASLEWHFGYAYRSRPCTNDAGSCSYLDSVYHSHDLGMLYCGIIWATILAILFIWCVYTYSSPKTDEQLALVHTMENATIAAGTLERLKRSISSYRRQYLLQEFARPVSLVNVHILAYRQHGYAGRKIGARAVGR